MTEVTRLEVLQEARKLAEELGAVSDGSHWFERENGAGIDPADVAYRRVQPDEVCRVCICGAAVLAEVLRSDQRVEWYRFLPAAYYAAKEVSGLEHGSPLTDPITQRGTPYVLAVLDRMVEREQEKVTA